MRIGVIRIIVAVLIPLVAMACSASQRAEWARKQREQARREEQRRLARLQRFCSNPRKYNMDAPGMSAGEVAQDALRAGPFGITLLPFFATTGLTITPFIYTTECEDGKPRRTAEFVRHTHSSILVDAARGYGAHLDSLAELLEVPSGSRPAFRAQMQDGVPRLARRGPRETYEHALTVAMSLER